LFDDLNLLKKIVKQNFGGCDALKSPIMSEVCMADLASISL